MGWLEPLRRLIGPPAKQPDINITIDPGCVIRPGDTVVIAVARDAFPGACERVTAAGANWLPAGARLVVSADESLTIVNATKLLQQVLGANRCDCSRDTRPEPLHPANGVPDRPQEAVSEPAEGAVSGADDAAERVPRVLDVPKPSPEPLSDSHSVDSP